MSCRLAVRRQDIYLTLPVPPTTFSRRGGNGLRDTVFTLQGMTLRRPVRLLSPFTNYPQILYDSGRSGRGGKTAAALDQGAVQRGQTPTVLLQLTCHSLPGSGTAATRGETSERLYALDKSIAGATRRHARPLGVQ